MAQHNTNRVSRAGMAGAILAAALLIASPAALAQQKKPAPEPTLKGPEVNDRNVPGAMPDFGTGVNRRFFERMPPEVFRRALGVIAADDAPDEIRATPAQREQFRKLVEGFEDQAKKYRREHAKEIDALRREAGERIPQRGAKKADAPEPMDSMDSMSPDEQKAREGARMKLRELLDGAPKIEDVFTKVWTDLSEPQRIAVQANLDAWRDEQSKKREDEYVRRQLAQKGKAPTPPASRAAPDRAADEMMAPMTDQAPPRAGAPNRPARADDARITPERRERLMRILARLTPEEQDQLLQRLEERLKDRADAAPPQRRGGAAAPARGKPAPDPNRVNVPKPEDDKN